VLSENIIRQEQDAVDGAARQFEQQRNLITGSGIRWNTAERCTIRQ
jgi:hypothetical protein